MWEVKEYNHIYIFYHFDLKKNWEKNESTRTGLDQRLALEILPCIQNLE